MATTPPYINEAEAIAIMQNIVISGEYVSETQLETAINNIPTIINSGFIPVSSSVLPNPTSRPDGYSMVPGPATYTQTTGGSIVTTLPLNIIAWDGTTWTLTFGIDIDLAEYLKSDQVIWESINLYDKSETSDEFGTLDGHYVVGGGTIGTNAQYARSPKINVTVGKTIYFKRLGAPTVLGCVYDISDTFVANISATGTTGSFVVPVGGSYIILNVSNTSATRTADKNAFIIQYDNPVTTYYPFQKTLVSIGDVVISPSLLKESDLATRSQNIFNKAEAIDGSFIVQATGLVSVNSTFSRSDFIRIDRTLLVDDKLWFRRINGSAQFGALYEENNEDSFIVDGIPTIAATLNVGSIDIPAEANYIRVTISKTVANRPADKDAFQLAYANMDYVPYELGIYAIKGIPIETPDSDVNPWVGKRVVALGDSITIAPDNFVDRACSTLGMTFVENNGINGSVIAQLVSDPMDRDPMSVRYTGMTEDNIDLIIVAGGTNDCNYGWTPFGTMADRTVNTFYGALHVLCEGLKNKYLGKAIVFCTPLKRKDNLATPDTPNTVGKTEKDYADTIKQVCAYYGIPVCDFFSNCRINPFLPDYLTLYTTDGTHPNTAGKIVQGKDLSTFLLTVAP